MPDNLSVAAPANYVPRTALSYGAAGGPAIPVDEASPLPIGSGAPGAQAATIAAGVAITPAIDLGGQRLHRLVVPGGWTNAAITFQSSHDGVTFVDLHEASGEVTLAAGIVGGGARAIVVDPAVFLGVRHLKIRSGAAGSPVMQPAARDLVLVTVTR